MQFTSLYLGMSIVSMREGNIDIGSQTCSKENNRPETISWKFVQWNKFIYVYGSLKLQPNPLNAYLQWRPMLRYGQKRNKFKNQHSFFLSTSEAFPKRIKPLIKHMLLIISLLHLIFGPSPSHHLIHPSIFNLQKANDG